MIVMLSLPDVQFMFIIVRIVIDTFTLLIMFIDSCKMQPLNKFQFNRLTDKLVMQKIQFQLHKLRYVCQNMLVVPNRYRKCTFNLQSAFLKNHKSQWTIKITVFFTYFLLGNK